MKLKLISDSILVEPIVETHSRGGIMFAPKYQSEFTSEPKLFRVLDVGPGRRNSRGELIPMEVSVGDRVLVHSYHEGPVPFDDTRRLIRPHLILLVFPSQPTPEQKETL